MSNRVVSILNEVVLKLREDVKKEEIQQRTKQEIRTIQGRRVLVFLISSFWIVLGWITIIYSTIYEDELKELINTLSGAESDFLQEWSATITMTAVGYIVPWILGKLSAFSAWDFAEEALYDDLLKNYYTSMMNIIVFMIIQHRNLLDDSPPYMEDGEPIDYEYNCKEDNITDEILKLFISEIVLRYAYYLYWILHWYVKSLIFKDC